MGFYLNSKKPSAIFRKTAQTAYFVDKTSMLNEMILLAEESEETITESKNSGENNKYICITRPRRFGKTLAASMIASYFGKGRNSKWLFENLAIGENPQFEKHLNKYNVIYITFSELPDVCKSYTEYIQRIKQRLLSDLRREFSDIEMDENMSVWDALNNIYELGEDVEFIFVLDEWDYIFHQNFVTEEDKKSYIKFLSNLLKDQPYVRFAYMTGILPIAKYLSGSELNMFWEYTMAGKEKYSEYFGFSDEEVDNLYQRYLKIREDAFIARDELRFWYNGYSTISGKHLYNPRSVICALTDNHLGSYWTSSGPYDEIYYYVEHNIAAVRDDLALMVSGILVPAKVQEYAAVSMNLTTRDEIFSAMVVYGFLSYEKGCVCVPNKDLMDKFDEMLQKHSSLGYVFRLVKESDRMLAATLAGDETAVGRILEYAHNTEIPLLAYNKEEDLTVLVTLLYLSARNKYRMERENKAGIGFADFIFYPLNPDETGIVLELKVDDSAENALQQIKDRKYVLGFEPKLSEKTFYTGRVLGVGIAYDKNTKEHSCKIEVLRECKK